MCSTKKPPEGSSRECGWRWPLALVPGAPGAAAVGPEPTTLAIRRRQSGPGTNTTRPNTVRKGYKDTQRETLRARGAACRAAPAAWHVGCNAPGLVPGEQIG